MTDNRRNAKHEKAARLRAEGHAHDSIADAVGVTVRTVERWQSKGILPDPPITNGNGSGNGEAMTLTEARTRKEAALARLRELDVAQREKGYVPMDEAERFVRDGAHRLRIAVERFPVRYGVELADSLGVDPGKLTVCLEGYVRRMLNDFVDDFLGGQDDAASKSA